MFVEFDQISLMLDQVASGSGTATAAATGEDACGGTDTCS